jgi:hypothetical protein
MRWRVLTCFAKFGTGFSHVRTGILWVRAGFTSWVSLMHIRPGFVGLDKF